ncbi:MAG TPA: hypothetical protein GX707_13940 [Epulopiscium sp.]|nr:hypothetical protein [Candidatus Epulonipiscium sp.]
MTNDEASKVAIWAVSIADKYNMQITKVIEIFKAINQFHEDVEVAKNKMEEGFIEAIREGLANG